MKSLFRGVAWLGAKAWWLLDASRRAFMNLLMLGLIVVIVSALWSRGPRPLQDKTTLVLRLEGNLVEQYSGGPRERLQAELSGQGGARQTRLRDVLRALEAAAVDPHISQVLLDTDELGAAGMAGLHEVSAALQRFRQKGKPVLAYGERFSQRAYYLAAQADQVYLHPYGMVMIEGFGRYRTYYKDALERVGIQPHLIKVGTYKSFAEPYIATGPSPATQEAEGLVYGELWSRYTADIEAARKLERGSIAQAIDQLPQRLTAVQGDAARMAVQERLVDALKTRDEMRELLITQGARDATGKSYRRVNLSEYLLHLKPSFGKAPIGVIVAEGEIVDGEAGPGRVGGDSTAKLVRQAREDDAIKAVVLRVNSPGGSVFASEVVRRELEITRKAGKPIVVSMGDVAASGGYWISMSSDAVLADPGTITGSIGVFGLLPTAEALMEKLSLKTAGITTTWLAGGYDPRRPLDPRLQAAVQASISNIYGQFTAQAAAARKTTPDRIDAVAQGRIWTGAQAKERGLIDRLGSLADAVQEAARLAKLELKDGEKPRVGYVEREQNPVERLFSSMTEALTPGLVAAWGGSIGLQMLPAPVAQELAFVSAMGREVREGRWDRAAVVHCLCSAP